MRVLFSGSTAAGKNYTLVMKLLQQAIDTADLKIELIDGTNEEIIRLSKIIHDLKVEVVTNLTIKSQFE